MNMKKIVLTAACVLLAGSLAAQTPSGVIDWYASNYPSVQRWVGRPEVVQTDLGPAVYFDGESGAFLDENPLQGMKQLTIEVIFKPDGDGKFAQRFMHLGEVMGERIMFETRVNPDKTWYFDAYVKSPSGEGEALIDEELLHPTDRWYNVTLVVNPTMITTYVNGTPQKWANLKYEPINKGVSSIGVRQNLVDFFKGTIHRIRITPKTLVPREFLKDYEELNK